jgi:Rrf2 family protein
MKFSSQEEYGLRCLLQLSRPHASSGEPAGWTIPEISRATGLSEPYVAKLMGVLRRGGLVQSVRGQAGGYALARRPEQVPVGEALAVLGGRLFAADFCDRHPGHKLTCMQSDDCSIRSLWGAVQQVVDRVLNHTTLRDLLGNERQMAKLAGELITISEQVTLKPAHTQ